ncbi:MAG: DUF434 domain-containing protein [Sphingobacteriales bacterium]|nr:DUF434 domain-containing protein [Sphingobacteriales bacterium]
MNRSKKKYAGKGSLQFVSAHYKLQLSARLM